MPRAWIPAGSPTRQRSPDAATKWASIVQGNATAPRVGAGAVHRPSPRGRRVAPTSQELEAQSTRDASSSPQPRDSTWNPSLTSSVFAAGKLAASGTVSGSQVVKLSKPGSSWFGHFCARSLVNIRTGTDVLAQGEPIAIRYDLQPVRATLGGRTPYLATLDAGRLRHIGKGRGIDALDVAKSWVARECLCAKLVPLSPHRRTEMEVKIQAPLVCSRDGLAVVLLQVVSVKDLVDEKDWTALGEAAVVHVGPVDDVECPLCGILVPRQELLPHLRVGLDVGCVDAFKHQCVTCNSPISLRRLLETCHKQSWSKPAPLQQRTMHSASTCAPAPEYQEKGVQVESSVLQLDDRSDCAEPQGNQAMQGQGVDGIRVFSISCPVEAASRYQFANSASPCMLQEAEEETEEDPGGVDYLQELHFPPTEVRFRSSRADHGNVGPTEQPCVLPTAHGCGHYRNHEAGHANLPAPDDQVVVLMPSPNGFADLQTTVQVPIADDRAPLNEQSNLEQFVDATDLSGKKPDGSDAQEGARTQAEYDSGQSPNHCMLTAENDSIQAQSDEEGALHHVWDCGALLGEHRAETAQPQDPSSLESTLIYRRHVYMAAAALEPLKSESGSLPGACIACIRQQEADPNPSIANASEDRAALHAAELHRLRDEISDLRRQHDADADRLRTQQIKLSSALRELDDCRQRLQLASQQVEMMSFEMGTMQQQLSGFLVLRERGAMIDADLAVVRRELLRARESAANMAHRLDIERASVHGMRDELLVEQERAKVAEIELAQRRMDEDGMRATIEDLSINLADARRRDRGEFYDMMQQLSVYRERARMAEADAIQWQQEVHHCRDQLKLTEAARENTIQRHAQEKQPDEVKVAESNESKIVMADQADGLENHMLARLLAVQQNVHREASHSASWQEEFMLARERLSMVHNDHDQRTEVCLALRDVNRQQMRTAEWLQIHDRECCAVLSASRAVVRDQRHLINDLRDKLRDLTDAAASICEWLESVPTKESSTAHGGANCRAPPRESQLIEDAQDRGEPATSVYFAFLVVCLLVLLQISYPALALAEGVDRETLIAALIITCLPALPHATICIGFCSLGRDFKKNLPAHCWRLFLWPLMLLNPSSLPFMLVLCGRPLACVSTAQQRRSNALQVRKLQRFAQEIAEGAAGTAFQFANTRIREATCRLLGSALRQAVHAARIGRKRQAPEPIGQCQSVAGDLQSEDGSRRQAVIARPAQRESIPTETASRFHNVAAELPGESGMWLEALNGMGQRERQPVKASASSSSQSAPAILPNEGVPQQHAVHAGLGQRETKAPGPNGSGSSAAVALQNEASSESVKGAHLTGACSVAPSVECTQSTPSRTQLVDSSPLCLQPHTDSKHQSPHGTHVKDITDVALSPKLGPACDAGELPLDALVFDAGEHDAESDYRQRSKESRGRSLLLSEGLAESDSGSPDDVAFAPPGEERTGIVIAMSSDAQGPVAPLPQSVRHDLAAETEAFAPREFREELTLQAAPPHAHASVPLDSPGSVTDARSVVVQPGPQDRETPDAVVQPLGADEQAEVVRIVLSGIDSHVEAAKQVQPTLCPQLRLAFVLTHLAPVATCDLPRLAFLLRLVNWREDDVGREFVVQPVLDGTLLEVARVLIIGLTVFHALAQLVAMTVPLVGCDPWEKRSCDASFMFESSIGVVPAPNVSEGMRNLAVTPLVAPEAVAATEGGREDDTTEAGGDVARPLHQLHCAIGEAARASRTTFPIDGDPPNFCPNCGSSTQPPFRFCVVCAQELIPNRNVAPHEDTSRCTTESVGATDRVAQCGPAVARSS